MNENFQWLAGLPTLITTGIATVVEILAYYIPYVDHLLDTASVPLATIAGSIMFAAQFYRFRNVSNLGNFALIGEVELQPQLVQDLQEHEPLLLRQLADWKFCSCHHRKQQEQE